MNRRYSYGFSPFAFSVSMILYAVALADAPSGLLENNQLRLSTVNGRILFSARLSITYAMSKGQGVKGIKFT